MKLENPNCPECGEPAHGTLERLCGYAEFVGVPGPDAPVEYSGWTEIWWDEQRTVHQNDGATDHHLAAAFFLGGVGAWDVHRCCIALFASSVPPNRVYVNGA